MLAFWRVSNRSRAAPNWAGSGMTDLRNRQRDSHPATFPCIRAANPAEVNWSTRSTCVNQGLNASRISLRSRSTARSRTSGQSVASRAATAFRPCGSFCNATRSSGVAAFSSSRSIAPDSVTARPRSASET